MPRPFEAFFEGQRLINQAEVKFKRNKRREHLKLRNRLVWEIQMAEKEGDISLANSKRIEVQGVNRKLRSP